MSKNAVIVALLLVVGLGIAALLLTRGNGTPAATGPLLVFNSPDVTEVRVDYPDNSSQGVYRDGEIWRVILRDQKQPDRSWPAAQTQVHAALRILSALRPDEESSAHVKTAAGTLRIKAGANEQMLTISDQRLGGRVLVETGSHRAAWVDASVAEMLVTTGIKAWRDPAAFPGVGAEASRVFIEGSGGSKIVLARVQGQWSIREPVMEPAHPDAISRLFGILSAARIEDFCDQGPPSEPGLEKPVAKLAIETDSRDGGNASVTSRQSLAVGRAADVGGRTVVARIERQSPGSEPTSNVVIVAGEHLAAISTDLTLYLSKQSIRSAPAAVGQLVITAPHGQTECKTLALRRTLDGWESRCGEKDWGPALLVDVQAVDALLELLAQNSAENVTLRGSEPTPQLDATIQLATAGGAPIGEVAIIIDGTRLVTLTERVRREYRPGDGKVAAEWLGRR